MADYNPYYASPGFEITVKFRIKAHRGTEFNKDVLGFLLHNTLANNSNRAYLNAVYDYHAGAEIIKIDEVKF